MSEWKKARKKPVVVEFRETQPKILIRIKMPEGLEVWGEIINTLEGLHEAHVDKDFVIRGVNGELYPIKKDIFYKTYEVIGMLSTLQNGTCMWCGATEHKDLERLGTWKLFKEIERLKNQDTLETINEFHDQQGNIGRIGCIENELWRRYNLGHEDSSK